jgi:glycosyltransferase involved in cell wall biosynthesis
MSKPQTYIIYYSWINTKNNHAGMAYLMRELKRNSQEEVKLIEIPKNINKWPSKLQRLHFYILAIWLKIFLGNSGKIIFTEFLGGLSGNQTGLAIKLRQWRVENRFIGLVHLSGNYLLELYDNVEDIRRGVDAVDQIVVFGSSLASFFAELGYGQKVIKTFHYVDTNYYKPATESKHEKLQVIHIGSIKRNFEKLREIVIECPDIDFHICQGFRNLSEHFNNLDNVKLYSFLSEEKLLKLMQSCHVSLNILDDTIGSNVITTSMACGLVNVVSDVGSVRDYCSNKNSILCKDNKDFVAALNHLNSARALINKLSCESLAHSRSLALDKSVHFFINEL